MMNMISHPHGCYFKTGLLVLAGDLPYGLALDSTYECCFKTGLLVLAGDLPYVLALDRPTKSVVVAIRGTVSVADLATDMLADPEPMEEWLPRNMKTMVSIIPTQVDSVISPLVPPPPRVPTLIVFPTV